MSATTGLSIMIGVLVLGAALSLWDLQRDVRSTLVIYTTPALRDLLEKDVLPRFERETGLSVSLVYVPAGQQYNRLRMGGERSEADVFLHASPLWLEKGYAESHVDPIRLEQDERLEPWQKSAEVPGGRSWYAFAWSPLVAVYPQSVTETPDLVTTDASFGFAHPTLSNNGVYGAVFFDHVDPAAAENVLAHTKAQPTNARANIGGIAEGSFGLTLGYEAVVKFYEAQGASLNYGIPVVDGERVTTPVLCSASVIRGHRNPHAEAFVKFLFTNESQSRLPGAYFRSVFADAPTPPGFVDVDDPSIRHVRVDWSRWEEIEARLPEYEVRR